MKIPVWAKQVKRQENKQSVIIINKTYKTWGWSWGWSWSADFLWLSDTPDAYTWQAWKAVVVNWAADWLEFVNASWTWDMTRAVYDTTNNWVVDNSEALNGQAWSHYLARANHTWTQPASTISDFDTEVSNNTDVAANTAARHTHANMTVLNNTTASFLIADETKLDWIEAWADVTDATNVAAAWAFMKASDDTDDITEWTTKKFATASEKTKVWYLTVTQAVDLDQMEIDIATVANAIWDLVPYTWATSDVNLWLNWLTTNDLNISWQTALTIAILDASKNVISASTATYPNLTELSYLKWLTSAIQTQLNAKQATDADLTDLIAKWTAASSSWPSSLQFAEDTDNWTSKVTIQAPASLAADYTLTLPVDDWTSWQYLKTDWSWVLSWDTPAWGWSTWINVWYALTGTYASTTTFTFSWDAWDAEAIERSLFTCLSTWGSTRRIWYVKSASHSSGTVTVTVCTDSDLASWDNTFKVAINRKAEDYEKLITIPWEQIADASNPQWIFYRSLVDSYLLPVNSFVRTAAAWSGAACAWNVYKWATNLFTSSQDMTTSATFDEKRPNTNTITSWDIISLRVTSSAWATNKASDLQVQLFIVPQTLYTTAD